MPLFYSALLASVSVAGNLMRIVELDTNQSFSSNGGLCRLNTALWNQARPAQRSPMAAPTYTSSLTIGELEASFPVSSKALRLLVRDGVSENKARRTVCWNRLETLHGCLPRQYRDPHIMYVLFKRDLNQACAG